MCFFPDPSFGKLPVDLPDQFCLLFRVGKVCFIFLTCLNDADLLCTFSLDTAQFRIRGAFFRQDVVPACLERMLQILDIRLLFCYFHCFCRQLL